MQFRTLLTRLAAALMLTLAAAGARADTWAFSLYPGSGSYQTYTWQLTSSVNGVYPSIGFIYYSVNVTRNITVSGRSFSVATSADITFYAGDVGGGLLLDWGVLDPTESLTPYTLSYKSSFFEQYYTGDEFNPSFKIGSYVLRGGGSGATLTISAAPDALPPAPVAAVPEPATVALMLAGLGVVGGVASRRRKAGREEAAAA